MDAAPAEGPASAPEQRRLCRDSLLTALCLSLLKQHSSLSGDKYPGRVAVRRSQGRLAGWQPRRVTEVIAENILRDTTLDEIVFWARDAEVSRLWLAGLADRSALPPEACWRFDSMLRCYLHVCETMFVQAALGAGGAGIVTAGENGIRQVFRSQGARDWWQANPFGFSQRFRTYIDGITAPRRGPEPLRGSMTIVHAHGRGTGRSPR